MKKNMRTFEVKYFGPTGYLGSRVQITDLLKSEKRTIAYNYDYTNIMDMAIDFLEKELGIEIMFTSESPKGYLLHTEDFRTSIKK